MAHAVVVDILIERLLKTLVEELAEIRAVGAQARGEFGEAELRIEIHLLLVEATLDTLAERGECLPIDDGCRRTVRS